MEHTLGSHINIPRHSQACLTSVDPYIQVVSAEGQSRLNLCGFHHKELPPNNVSQKCVKNTI